MRAFLQTLESICENGAELHYVEVTVVPKISQAMFDIRQLYIPFVHLKEGEPELELPYNFYVEITKHEKGMICLKSASDFLK
jgi:hypothetical protein